ncbi:MAG: thiol:disulfide interchange protein DsbA/DsbL [Burkholderiaceae bacterium]
MSLNNLFLRAFAVIAIGSGALFLPATQASAANSGPYTTVSPAQPSDTEGKIEVLEFFAYTCPHCNAIEPLVEKWTKTLPANVVFRSVPVAFNASMVDLQKLYYSLDAMGRLDLHPAVFKAIHEQHKQIFNAKAITDWVAAQGVDRAQFEAVFNSFGINSKVTRANELAKNYKIEGTPSLAVGGQYVTSPSETKSYAGTIEEAQKLLELVTKK